MKYFSNTTDFSWEKPTAVTLGKFDGLHRGHQKLLAEVSRLRSQEVSSAVFAIAPPERPYLLSPEEKREMIERYNMDCMVACPFIPEILHMAPEEFIRRILKERLHARYVVVGTDFRFGYQRSGDAALLQAVQKTYGLQVLVLEKECCRGREISSTYVREALEVGDMELVQELLGYAYPVQGIVQHGHQLGRRLGMPTINLIPEPGKLLPPSGVYFSDVEAGGRWYQGVTNIGVKPTVDGSFLGVETYLYDFHQDIYGRETKVHLRHYCRPERKFESVEALKHQMEKDIYSGKEYFRVS